MFGYEYVKSLFMPGEVPKVPRRANHLKKGFLKKTVYSVNRSQWKNNPLTEQGTREKARRLRQIERGIIHP